MSGTTNAPRLSRSTASDGRVERAPIRIVHVGLGAFHRAHQAWYTDVVDVERRWGIAAFTGRTPEAAAELAQQDGLFTVIERSSTEDVARVVASIVEAVPGSDVARLTELLAASTTSMITTTVTEAGYRLRPDGSPDISDDAVRSDLAALGGGGAPATALGRILVGLMARRTAGSGPIALVPCDNIPDNGAVVRRGLLGLAELVDDGLAAWIDANVSFVSTSVDRITPRTTPDDLVTARELTGFSDEAAVVTEPFHDWVLSGDFPAGRPAWELAGARFVENIAPFERRKLWMLNGSHTLLAYAARARGHHTVSSAIGDPVVRRWVDEFWDEAARHLPEDLDLADYRTALLSRYENARIVHLLAQIGQDGVTKLRMRVVPILLAERAAGRDGAASLRAVAAWVALRLADADLPDSADVALVATRGSSDRVASLLAVVDDRLVSDDDLLADIRCAASRY